MPGSPSNSRVPKPNNLSPSIIRCCCPRKGFAPCHQEFLRTAIKSSCIWPLKVLVRDQSSPTTSRFIAHGHQKLLPTKRFGTLASRVLAPCHHEILHTAIEGSCTCPFLADKLSRYRPRDQKLFPTKRFCTLASRVLAPCHQEFLHTAIESSCT